MISGEGTALIRRPARDILEFVLDFERYRQADTKIRKVHGVERNGNEGVLRYSGRIRGIPTPMVEHAWRLIPYSRLEVRSLTRDLLLDRFAGLFTCEETAEGTRVTHRETFVFHPAVSGLIERFLRGWLARDVATEVGRMKDILERDPAPPEMA